MLASCNGHLVATGAAFYLVVDTELGNRFPTALLGVLRRSPDGKDRLGGYGTSKGDRWLVL